MMNVKNTMLLIATIAATALTTGTGLNPFRLGPRFAGPDGREGWQVGAFNGGFLFARLSVYALCATVP